MRGFVRITIFLLYPFLSKNFIDGRIPADYINACHENAHLGDASAKYLFISTECNFTTDNCIYMINGMHNNNDVIDEYIHINPAIENVMIQDAKKLPQVEQPTEFVRQAEIFLN